MGWASSSPAPTDTAWKDQEVSPGASSEGVLHWWCKILSLQASSQDPSAGVAVSSCTTCGLGLWGPQKAKEATLLFWFSDADIHRFLTPQGNIETASDTRELWRRSVNILRKIRAPSKGVFGSVWCGCFSLQAVLWKWLCFAECLLIISILYCSLTDYLQMKDPVTIYE